MVNSELPNDMILTSPILFMSQSPQNQQVPTSPPSPLPPYEELGVTTTSGLWRPRETQLHAEHDRIVTTVQAPGSSHYWPHGVEKWVKVVPTWLRTKQMRPIYHLMLRPAERRGATLHLTSPPWHWLGDTTGTPGTITNITKVTSLLLHSKSKMLNW